MVARINTGKSISKALHYNESKVREGHAEYLFAQNAPKSIDQMNFYEKQKLFEKYTSLNDRTTTNTVHISLNFDPSENLSNEKLKSIAESYMTRIGFATQPYLVYRHHDTGHPHIHIVSTNIKMDGSRISMHNLGARLSEPARKEIENDYDLVKAESKHMADALKLSPVNAQKLNPGKRSSKAAISNVLSVVISQYKYSSLPELNAVLKLYNVTADRCGESSSTYQHDGLLYRVLDEKGNKTGTPIKASLFYMKPTLANLGKRFIQNHSEKKQHARRMRTCIDYVLFNNSSMGLKELDKKLQQQHISMVVRSNNEGRVYGITFVDHKTKCVFNGSDLGKSYSAQSIQERCIEKPIQHTETLKYSVQDEHPKKNTKTHPATETQLIPGAGHFFATGDVKNQIVDLLIAADKNAEYIPYPLRKKRKKKTRKLRW